MSLEERVARMEKELVVLEDIIASAEFRARESAAYVSSLLVLHLRDIEVIDIGKLKVYLGSHHGDVSDRDDYMGETVRFLTSLIAVQEKDPILPGEPSIEPVT